MDTHNKQCSIDGCEGTVAARGWCGKHYGRWIRTGDPESPDGRKGKEVCSMPDCESRCAGEGMCHVHYTRWRRYGDPSILKKLYRHASPVCSVEGCEKETCAKGLCQNHYALNRRHGEPVRKKVFVGHYIKDGYRYVHVAHRHYEPEHRLVMERFLGRKLESSENVHHIDGDTLNNSPSNLEILSRSEHLKRHIKGQPRGARGRYIKKEEPTP